MDAINTIWNSLNPESKLVLIDILGALIGFAAVMTALGLLVTAVVQGIIYVSQLRVRNLRHGLARLLEIADNQALEPSLVEDYRDYAAKLLAMQETKKIVMNLRKEEVPLNARAPAEKEYAKALLAFNKAKKAKKALTELRGKKLHDEELRDKELSDQEISQEQRKPFKQIADRILNLNCLVKKGKTWIQREELEMLLVESTEFENENIDKAMQWFTRMERWLSARFQRCVRCITLICALVVAFIFQVSSPELLKSLSVNPKMRIEAAQAIQKRISSGEKEDSYEESLKKAADLALKQLQEKNPDNERLEQVSAVGDQIKGYVNELSLVLRGDENRDNLANDYEKMILSNVRKMVVSQADEVIVENLTLIDITPLSRGWSYYINLSNLLGMLMTAVLLNFGAPFWYNTLHNLMSLRDALAPEKAKQKSKA